MPGGPRGFGAPDRTTDLRMRYAAWWFHGRNRYDRQHPPCRYVTPTATGLADAARRVRARNAVQLAALRTVQTEQAAADLRSAG